MEANFRASQTSCHPQYNDCRQTFSDTEEENVIQTNLFKEHTLSHPNASTVAVQTQSLSSGVCPKRPRIVRLMSTVCWFDIEKMSWAPGLHPEGHRDMKLMQCDDNVQTQVTCQLHAAHSSRAKALLTPSLLSLQDPDSVPSAFLLKAFRWTIRVEGRRPTSWWCAVCCIPASADSGHRCVFVSFTDLSGLYVSELQKHKNKKYLFSDESTQITCMKLWFTTYFHLNSSFSSKSKVCVCVPSFLCYDVQRSHTGFN